MSKKKAKTENHIEDKVQQEAVSGKKIHEAVEVFSKQKITRFSSMSIALCKL